MKKDIMKLSIMLLDTQDGVNVEIYDQLKKLLIAECGSDGKDLMDNVIVVKGVAFLNETYAEENFSKFE